MAERYTDEELAALHNAVHSRAGFFDEPTARLLATIEALKAERDFRPVARARLLSDDEAREMFPTTQKGKQ